MRRVLRKVERALPDLPRRRFAVVAGANRWRELLTATSAFVRPGAVGPDVVRELERDFAAAAGTRFAFAFGAGRMALYVLLEALGLKAGDEVVVPGFTCAVVPNALVYRGLVPVYADIEPVTFNVDPRCVAERVTPRTRALYLQHTFGVTGPVEELRAIADRHGLVIVEDCAHSLGARHRGRPHGSLSDAAFFSLDRTKVVNSHSGGVVATDDGALAARLSELQAALPLPGTSQVRRMLFTFAAECALHAPGLYWLGRPAWALLWRTPLFFFYDDEESEERPGAYPYPCRLPPAIARLGRSQLAALDANLAHRRLLARFLEDRIGRYGPVLGDRFDEQAWLRYAFLVRSPRAFERRLSWRFDLATWFPTPIYGRPGSADRVGFEPGACPVAERVSRHVVNLPTHPRLPLAALRRLWARHGDWIAEELIGPESLAD